MNYALEIREHNRQPHLDIEKDIESKRNGLFTFVLRVNNGNIVDYNLFEYADARKYLILKEIVIEEFTITHGGGVGSTTDPLRPDNI